MFRKLASALVTSAAFFCYVPAKADVIYNLTFYDDFSFTTSQGTGVVDLNFPTIAASFNYNASLAPVLVSITTSDLDGHGTFSITPADLNSGSQLQTGNVGQVFTLTATQAGSGAGSVLFLDLFTNSWQLHGGGAFGPTVDDGAFRITGPTLASPVPGPLAGAGLPGLMIAGGGFLAWWRRKRNVAIAAA